MRELLRMFSVVSSQRRVTRDFVWYGVQMKEKDLVVMSIFIACRDPEAYPNPNQIDLERAEQTLSFASGPHLCLGMHLARRELKIAIQSFLDRFDDIHIPGVLHYLFSKPLVWNSQLIDIFATCTDVKNAVCASPLGIGQISDDSTKDYFNNKGLYARATYRISDQLSMTGGIRYTMDR
ncbi:cytochrome P450 [Novosphingobium mangrovi (ex Huang et al. 2023)]|uniref:Cytochrome P450 n=1 Tax=Novosphingobium mangrovi (ex Huang et al. 2023) TaxID=2976432 RepID=A0ABT2I498_9SPHN|nr:cytochrome P450 [Novosphingobium mangrovi (ex Huang et al. 2023)]MCT2399630.1 cytochrome P450 [Novosphingobium mangrovi (ex Huang et al. 2023)]